MRVVSGRFRGTHLVSPKGDSTRPTSDRVREAIFNVLARGLEGFEIEGARVLDLFAGTGALGIEALSRGAHYCLFIEKSADARALLRRNVEALLLTGVTKIWRRDASRLGGAGKREPFSLVFLDPPYGQRLGEAALTAMAEGGWIAPGAIAVLEESAAADLAVPQGYEVLDRRRYGGTQVLFLKFP